MAFPAEARRVRDESLPPPARLLALKRCVSAYAPFGYHDTMALLAALHGPLAEPPAMLAALRTLESGRRSWRSSLAALVAYRRAVRRSGRRPARAGLRRQEAELIGGFGWPGGLHTGPLRVRRQWRQRQVETLFLAGQGVLALDERRVEQFRRSRGRYRLERRGQTTAGWLAAAVCGPLFLVNATVGALLIKPLALSEAEFVTGFTVATVPLFYLHDVLRRRFARWLKRRAAAR
ncbi:hypothetical protein [Catellatospora sp. IY07-71]|uniref:hypothetical protein n=1 Tax=Catellatospora sp. IY07-71 TaxID=2728827 RepID=UPI001BB30B99|nr:hypothetical protein [Catellatospora sp. IY07-71]